MPQNPGQANAEALANSSQFLRAHANHGDGTVVGTAVVLTQCFSSRGLRQGLRQQHDRRELLRQRVNRGKPTGGCPLLGGQQCRFGFVRPMSGLLPVAEAAVGIASGREWAIGGLCP
jgi:hypothetical protein